MHRVYIDSIFYFLSKVIFSDFYLFFIVLFLFLFVSLSISLFLILSACPNGKVYSTCGTMCPLTCENKDGPPMPCPAICIIGCFCPYGTIEYGNGCVAPVDCPTNTSELIFMKIDSLSIYFYHMSNHS